MLLIAVAFPVNAIQVIVNTSVMSNEINTAHLRRIFSMQQGLWPDGEKVVVFVLPKADPIHKKFTINQLHLFPYQLERSWHKLAFSGMGYEPQFVHTVQEMLDKVSTTKGAIGYVEQGELPIDVKEITVVEH